MIMFMKNNIIKKNNLKVGLLCLILCLNGISLFAEDKSFKVKYNKRIVSLKESDFFKCLSDIRDQVLADGYKGIYGQDIYYKGEGVKDKIDKLAKEGIKEFADSYDPQGHCKIKDIECITNEISLYILRSDCDNRFRNTLAFDFFRTTRKDKHMQEYFEKKSIYPKNYLLVTWQNFTYRLIEGGKYVLFTSYSDFIDTNGKEVLNAFLVKTENINDSYIKEIEKDLKKLQNHPVVSSTKIFKDKDGNFTGHFYIIEDEVYMNKEGGYEVKSFAGDSILESDEGFLPVLKPYRVKKNN